jgi:serine/threonine-protein kinase
MKKKHLGILIAIVVIVVAIYISFNLVMNAIIHSNKEVEVADVTGKTIAEALDIFSASGLAIIKEAEETDLNSKAGIVLRQSPTSGINVRQGQVVKITVSNNIKKALVPSLLGQFSRSADMILKSEHMMLGEVDSRFSLLGAKGVVVAQEPIAGSDAHVGMVVDIVLSEGPPPAGVRLMPLWVKKNIDQARDWGSRESIKVNIFSQTGTEATGTIVKQNPEADVDITEIDSVDFYVIE